MVETQFKSNHSWSDDWKGGRHSQSIRVGSILRDESHHSWSAESKSEDELVNQAISCSYQYKSPDVEKENMCFSNAQLVGNNGQLVGNNHVMPEEFYSPSWVQVEQRRQLPHQEFYEQDRWSQIPSCNAYPNHLPNPGNNQQWIKPQYVHPETPLPCHHQEASLQCHQHDVPSQYRDAPQQGGWPAPVPRNHDHPEIPASSIQDPSYKDGIEVARPWDDILIRIPFKNRNKRPFPGEKFLCTFIVGVPDDPTFTVAKRIIGRGGSHMKFIANICVATKLRLRGRGSGFRERGTNAESNIPLQINVSSPDLEEYELAKRELTSLLRSVYSDYKKLRSKAVKVKIMEHPRNPKNVG